MNENSGVMNYGRHKIDDEDIDAVTKVLRSEFLTTGPLVEKFENVLTRYFGNQNTVVCNNGTSALFLASKALGVSTNDVVIVPSQTFLATANAPHMLGAEVVFSDVDPDTGLLRAEDLLNAIHLARKRYPAKTLKAVFVVQLNGQVAYMPEIWKLAKEHGCFVIEDACHALGTSTNFEPKFGLKKVGGCEFSDAATFSFHPVKNITTGEGGAIAFREFKHASLAKLYRNHGMNRQDLPGLDLSLLPAFSWSYVCEEPSLNFRLPDILCALGISQIQKLTNWIDKRTQIWSLYDGLIADSGVAKLVKKEAWCEAAWHLQPVQIEFEELGKSRVNVFKFLNQRSIFPQVHYQPVHLQPYWVERYGRDGLPNAESYFKKTMSLPLFVEMTKSNVQYVVETLMEAINS